MDTYDYQITQIKNSIAQLQKAIAQASVAKKCLEENYQFNLSEIKRWENRVNLALLHENNYLAKEALLRKRHFTENAAKLKYQIQLDNSSTFVENLKQQLANWEITLADYKAMSLDYHSQEAQEKIQETVNAFEKMENKVIELEFEKDITTGIFDSNGIETKSKSTDLEQRLNKLENIVSTLQDEILTIKIQLQTISTLQIKEVDSILSASENCIIDAELEELRSKLNG